MKNRSYIKNMVCQRCIEAVGEELTSLGIEFLDIKLGAVTLKQALSIQEKKALKDALTLRGFELLEDKTQQLIEMIKATVISHLHLKPQLISTNYSTYLEKEIGKDYSYISSLFSSVEGITIEKYIILQKVEKVKELIIYDELSLSQIAHELDYSSVQYLSNQFKKITGMSPSEFKKIRKRSRNPLDKVGQ